MRQGSTGADVICLQTKLGVTADGKFGPMTAASVKAYQASNGLVADGVVGPMTRAILNASAVATPAGLPAGCTSTAGYSPITGEACSVVMTLPAGCLSTAGYSSTTGVKCDSSTSVSLPAGCLSTAGYSTVTGEKCDETSSSSSNGSLGNGDGSISNIKEVSSEDSDIEEGQSGEIFAFEVEIEGDVKIDRLDFYMESDEAGSSSADADDYFSSAILMVDGKEVASLDVDDFGEDDYDIITNDSTDEYRLRFSGLSLVYSDGDEPEFVVVMQTNKSIDSDDLAADWTIQLDAVRYVDGRDFSSTEDSTISESFGFDEEGDGEDLNLKSSSSDSINDDETLLVDASDESEWYEVFKFRLEGEENDIDLEELMLTVTTAAENYDEVVDDVYIEIDGNKFDDFSVADAGTTTADLTFDIDGDYTIDADDIVDVVVSMRFNQSSGYTSGTTTVKVQTVSVEGEGATDVSDTATIVGGTKTLSTSTAALSNFSWSVPSTGSIIDFFFTVEADENDFDVLSASILDTKVGTATGPTDTSVLPETSDFGVLSRYSGDSVTTLGGAGTETGFRVAEGDTVTFRVRYNFTGDNGTWAEVKITSVAGQEVPDDKEVSPTATLNIAS
ncbi:MAG: peptidoglycan-binding domain-containing protein [Candidatus Paceibacterota bacterium]